MRAEEEKRPGDANGRVFLCACAQGRPPAYLKAKVKPQVVTLARFFGDFNREHLIHHWKLCVKYLFIYKLFLYV